MPEFQRRWKNFTPKPPEMALTQLPEAAYVSSVSAPRSGSGVNICIDLPFQLGNGGLDAGEVAKAERSNDRLGVVDPVDRRLNVLVWLRQYYMEAGDTGMAAEVKAAYYSLRDDATDMAMLVRIGDHDQEVILKRLRDGQQWLINQHRAWAENDSGADDNLFRKVPEGPGNADGVREAATGPA
jgi:hypothetical protein